MWGGWTRLNALRVREQLWWHASNLYHIPHCYCHHGGEVLIPIEQLLDLIEYLLEGWISGPVCCSDNGAYELFQTGAGTMDEDWHLGSFCILGLATATYVMAWASAASGDLSQAHAMHSTASIAIQPKKGQ